MAKTKAKGAESLTAPGAATTVETDTRYERVEVGEIEIGVSTSIPHFQHAPRGSKYPFDKLAAPMKRGNKISYSNFMVKRLPKVAAQKLRRSVQSATTQANRQGAKKGKYFVSRTVTKGGVFIGMQVFRTDNENT